MQEKMLILGIDTATRFILAEARKKGIYTILTDYNPIEKAPLKKMADEAWMLNVGAIDELEEKCRESGVTAVIAGNHEFCLDSAKNSPGGWDFLFMRMTSAGMQREISAVSNSSAGRVVWL